MPKTLFYLAAFAILGLAANEVPATTIVLPGPTSATASSAYPGYPVTNLYDGNNPAIGADIGNSSPGGIGNDYAANNTNGTTGQDINPVVVYNYSSTGGVAAQGLAYSERSDPVTGINVWFKNTPYTPLPNVSPATTLGTANASLTFCRYTAPTDYYALTEHDFGQTLTGQYVVFQLVNANQSPTAANNPGGYELRLVQTPEPASMAIVGLSSLGLLARPPPRMKLCTLGCLPNQIAHYPDPSSATSDSARERYLPSLCRQRMRLG